MHSDTAGCDNGVLIVEAQIFIQLVHVGPVHPVVHGHVGGDGLHVFARGGLALHRVFFDPGVHMHDPLRKGQFERQPLIQHGVAHRPHSQLDALVPGRHNVETAGDNNQRRDGCRGR